jgi:oligosaccharyltransferase complex subunit gamma
MSSDKFNTYVKSKPKNYSIVAMLTALKPLRQCSVCKQAYQEYEILANSWRYSSQYSSELFFIMVDIDEDGMDVFQQLQLQTAPTYFHFPATGKRKPEDKYDVTRYGFSAEALANWVHDRAGVKVAVLRPPNFTVMLIWIPLLLLGAIVGYLKRENLYILYDSRLWAVFAMVRLTGP